MIRQFTAALAILCLAALPAAASVNPFKTAVTVNGIGISHYDLEQRERLLRSLNTRGDLRRRAQEALISERLYLEEAERLDLTVSEEEIADGIREFAARATLSPEQLLSEIKRFGVTENSFTDFVRAGLAWRKVVGMRFTAAVAQINPDDLERTLALQPSPTFTSVRLSEIALSLRPSAAVRSREIADQIRQTVTSHDEFAEIARSLSIAESRPVGGAIGWVRLDRLPGNVRAAVQSVPAGGVTQPVEAQNTLFVFFKHAVREESGPSSPEVADFAVLSVLPEADRNARERALRIAGQVTDCQDLRSVSREFPRGLFRVDSIETSSETTPYSVELTRLDAGETAILTTAESEAVELLMLCDRRALLTNEQRVVLLSQERNERLQDYASNLLDNLRAAALITRH